MLSERLFFIIERIGDILKLEKEREVEYSYLERIRKRRITNSILELHEVLSGVFADLRQVEQTSEEQRHHHDPLYLELCDIANSSDHILNGILSNDAVANDINHLVNRIRNYGPRLGSKTIYKSSSSGGSSVIEPNLIPNKREVESVSNVIMLIQFLANVILSFWNLLRYFSRVRNFQIRSNTNDGSSQQLGNVVIRESVARFLMDKGSSQKFGNFTIGSNTNKDGRQENGNFEIGSNTNKDGGQEFGNFEIGSNTSKDGGQELGNFESVGNFVTNKGSSQKFGNFKIGSNIKKGSSQTITNIGSNINKGSSQKITNIVSNINRGSREIDLFNPKRNTNLSGSQFKKPETLGEEPIPDLVGFKQEIQTLLVHLTQDSEFCVAGLVGMGGSGKTTLANHIYHHPEIMTYFTHRVWVRISHVWDKNSILNSIFRQAIDIKAKKMDYDQAVVRIYSYLNRFSYLVILDDIWSIDAWHHISPCLPRNRGSKVVVTTRNIGVPKCIDGVAHIFELRPLNDEESWELFKMRAFLPNNNISNELLQLGKEMVKKCNGLPLAIDALAGVLRMDIRPSRWESISQTWAYTILKGNAQSTLEVVEDILRLSYYALPHYLKPCVDYLRLFPEDYVINARSLMNIWIAEGFIDPKKDQESTAQECLDEIVQRCIVKVVKKNFTGQVSRFRVHDLTRQMLIDINKERGLLRHGDSLRLGSSATPDFCLGTSSSIRSLITISDLNLWNSVSQSMFPEFRLLRILILHDTSISGIEIPEEIGNLIHLRYMELRGCIKQLPRSIEKLRDLRTLNIRYCRWKGRAEINLCKSKELRHLYLPDEFLASIDMENLKLERLGKLKTLWNVRGGEWMLLGMIGLSDVLEELRVHHILSKEQLALVFRTPSITSNNLEILDLDWYGSGEGSVELDMNLLIECTSLTKLKLCGRIQASTNIIFSRNLIKLEMRNTFVEDGEVMNIISKSCPHLEILKFGSNAFVGEKLICNVNSIRELVKLTLEDLENLKHLKIAKNAMPRLRYLTIRRCEHLDLDHEDEARISSIPHVTFE